MFNGLAVVAATTFAGTTDVDTNGKSPVMLQCVAGKIPNRNVLTGTVAERAGLQVGHTYLVQCRERGEDKEHGKDFTWVKVNELNALEAMQAPKLIGDPEVFVVHKPTDTGYVRKTSKVISQRAQREQEGLYKRSGSFNDAQETPTPLSGAQIVTRQEPGEDGDVTIVEEDNDLPESLRKEPHTTQSNPERGDLK